MSAAYLRCGVLVRYWTEEEKDFLRECANARISATLIAPLLGRPAAVVRMKRHSMGLPPSSDHARYMTTQRGTATVADIKRVVAEHFEIPVEEMVSAKRTRDVARPRQVAMFFAREIACKSYPHIGQMFGDRDHSTAIHARQQIERLCEEKAAFAQEVAELRDIITNPQESDIGHLS